MKDFLQELRVLLSYPRNLVLLGARLVVAYGFSTPALVKMNDPEGAITWFASLGIPFPDLTAYTVAGLESTGVVLLILGLFTRPISLLLSFIMVGAILFVHQGHGFAAAANGIEIPLLYGTLLWVFVTRGAGRYSLDYWLLGDHHD